MYPLYTWKFDELEARLADLLAHGFHQEAAVAAAQTIEQALKRVLRSWMAEHRLGVQGRAGSRTGRVISSKKELDKDVKAHLASMDGIQECWKLLVSKSSGPQLQSVVKTVAGKASWTGLTSNGPCSVQTATARVRVPYGLFPLRHRLVHGTHSPDKAAIVALAEFGVRTTTDLLHPDNGITTCGLRDPFSKVFAFRPRKTDAP